jgi:hypothetical protein
LACYNKAGTVLICDIKTAQGDLGHQARLAICLCTGQLYPLSGICRGVCITNPTSSGQLFAGESASSTPPPIHTCPLGHIHPHLFNHFSWPFYLFTLLGPPYRNHLRSQIITLSITISFSLFPPFSHASALAPSYFISTSPITCRTHQAWTSSSGRDSEGGI